MSSSPTIDTFIKAVQHCCIDLGWNNKQLCEKADIHPATWSAIKSKRQAPTAVQLSRLQKACKIPESEIPANCKSKRRTIKAINFANTKLLAFAELQATMHHGGNFSAYINHLVKMDTVHDHGAYVSKIPYTERDIELALERKRA